MRTLPPLTGWVLTAAGLLLGPSAASAHALLIEARTEPGAVRVAAKYEGDIPADGARVTLTDAAGAPAAEGTTDGQGVCVLPRPGAGSYTVVVDDGAGHRAELVLAVPRGATEVTEARTATRNRWLMAALGLSAIAGGTALAWWLRRRATS